MTVIPQEYNVDFMHLMLLLVNSIVQWLSVMLYAFGMSFSKY